MGVRVILEILNSNLFASLIGAIIGGILSLLGTIITLNVQNKQAKKSKEEDYKKLIKSSLLVIQSEIAKNHVVAESILAVIIENNVDVGTSDFSIEKFNYKFESIAWKEYRNTLLPYFDGKDILAFIGYLYLQTDYYIHSNKGTINSIKEYVKMSDDITEEISKMINSLK